MVPFGVGAGVQGVENPSAIIAFDLARSGQFSPTPPENMLSMPTQPKDVLFRDWRVLGVEYVVIGRTEVAANGNLAVSYYLFDVLNERQLANETFTAPPTALRDMAHLVSDAVYEKLTGIPGAFSTRIVYVLARDLGTNERQVQSRDGRRRRRAAAHVAREPRADSVGDLVAGRQEGGVRVVRRRQAVDHPAGDRDRPAHETHGFPRSEQCARVLARRQDAGARAVARRRPRDLHDEHRHARVEAHHAAARHRHRAELDRRRQEPDLHVGPRRQTADLSDRTRDQT